MMLWNCYLVKTDGICLAGVHSCCQSHRHIVHCQDLVDNVVKLLSLTLIIILGVRVQYSFQEKHFTFRHKPPSSQRRQMGFVWLASLCMLGTLIYLGKPLLVASPADLRTATGAELVHLFTTLFGIDILEKSIALTVT
jgi:hypothetical protein